MSPPSPELHDPVYKSSAVKGVCRVTTHPTCV
jgi:hypothetical protein